MVAMIQNGLVERGRTFSVTVLVADKPGQFQGVSELVGKLGGNIVKLEKNSLMNVNRNLPSEVVLTIESFGNEHKEQIIKALEENGYCPTEVNATL